MMEKPAAKTSVIVPARTAGSHVEGTKRVLASMLSDDVSGFQETDNPREIAFVEYLISGINLGHAYLRAYRNNAEPSIQELRATATLAKQVRSKPGVKAYLQRRIQEEARESTRDARLLRKVIEQQLLEIGLDDSVSPSQRISALSKLGMLTDVRAFDPPERPDDRRDNQIRTASGVLAELKALLGKTKESSE